MRLASIGSPLLILVASFALLGAGCRCVDVSQVQTFACTAEHQCTTGQACCADGLCRDACADAGADAGLSSTDAGADAGLVSCGPDSCPDGCCDGATCVTPPSTGQCGLGGNVCQKCTEANDTCTNGVCSGCAAACTSGCCVGSQCVATSATACGGNGTACVACGIGGDGCSPTGDCTCGANPACGPGLKCSAGACICDTQSCPGCCAGDRCLSSGRQTSFQCGLGGVACAACEVPPLGVCTSSAARKGFQSPGGCVAGSCGYLGVDMACGFGCSGGSCINDACQGCLTPPQTACVGNTLRSWLSPGSCDGTGCTYVKQDTVCTFGCANNACKPDPCSSITCQSPPAAICADASTKVVYGVGTCADGSCKYQESRIPCRTTCANGECLEDSCLSVSCTSPGPATCVGSARHAFFTPGACADAKCTYAQQIVTCASGCEAGQCLGEPCQGIVCTSPPPASCLNATTRHSYGANGTCSGADCSYPATDFDCPFGCLNGSCKPDPCQGISCTAPGTPTCNGSKLRTFSSPGSCSGGGCTYPSADTSCATPPAPSCAGTTLTSYAAAGSCSSGACVYAPSNTTCAFGCGNGKCNADPCATVTCGSPPAAGCATGTSKRTYANPGTCSLGTCSYTPIVATCSSPPNSICVGSSVRVYDLAGTCSGGTCGYTFKDSVCANGCANGACNGDPCQGVSCATPPATTCSGNSVRTFAPSGTCSGGTCAYAPTDTACNAPPAPVCVSGKRRTFAASGTCAGGSCSYAPTDTDCTFGCSNGACSPDPCAGITCATPPATTCSGSSVRTFAATGTCSGGTCAYAPTDTACNVQQPATCAPDGHTRRTFTTAGTCSGGLCVYPSSDATCSSPPAATCPDSNTARTWTSPGACAAGVCSYSSGDTTCGFGCSNGICNGDPCQNVTCNSPPATACIGATLRIYDSTVTCNAGNCPYPFQDTVCVNGCTPAAGATPAACTPCNASTCATGCCSATGKCQVNNFSACGTAGAACPTAGCNGTRADNCTAGVCRCGTRTGMCSAVQYCDTGTCFANGCFTGQCP